MAEGVQGAPGPSKKRKKRECHYLNDWQNHGISRSSRGKNFGFCKLCGTHINISHGGVSDVRKHLATAKLQQMVQAELSIIVHSGMLGSLYKFNRCIQFKTIGNIVLSNKHTK